MQVLLSMNRSCNTYHISGCPYAKRIKYSNLMTVSKKKATERKYQPCKYCSGLHGFVRVNHKELSIREKTNNLKYSYSKTSDTMYLRTKAGFWKIFEKENVGYLLYHRNVFRDELSSETMMHGDFHRQGDAAATDSVAKLISYVIAHDKAKRIIENDYRKLPRRTEKQKKYYKAAERKDRRKKMARLNQLFDMLEKTGNCHANELRC